MSVECNAHTAHIDSCHALVCWFCRDEARQMFFAGYENYLLHAFPKVSAPLESAMCVARLAYAWVVNRCVVIHG